LRVNIILCTNGTQLQRRIELNIRKQKDTQILARASGDTELVEQSQNKIRLLTSKYNDLCKASGLLPKKQRMQVARVFQSCYLKINMI